MFIVISAALAQSGIALWKNTNESSIGARAKTDFDSHFKPTNYRLFNLDEIAFHTILTGVPGEQFIPTYKSDKIITIPGPDGILQQFRFVQTSVMSPQLALKYPDIKTFIGKGIDDPSAVIRFDYSPYGFHAMVTSADKLPYYVNPVDREKSIYVINARDPRDKNTQFKCTLDETSLVAANLLKATTIAGNADDGKLRLYDLALCVNGEFSQIFLDGSETNDAQKIAKVFSALVTCILRANEVYERDFGIRMQYVANEDTLIFLDPSTDPWPTKPPVFGSSWNTKTQSTIDARIGAANYDIGHLLGKVPTFADNNGNAGCIGCVCASGSKGSGFSAYNDPTLIDYMVIDYWTHEMGHQFGANHTFTFSSESTQAQIEPGSGSTIMGYAGITGSTDVQPHSDDLFSIASIGQVAFYTKTGAGSGCALTTVTGNTAPTANAGSDYIIPKSTPFLLTGSGSDVNAGDVITYVWEQTDVFEKNTSNTFPKATSTTGPVFRVYNDSILSVRAFPSLPTILAGQVTSTWEALPSVTRDLNFRFTVRDNHIGGGNNKSDDMKVTVSAVSGPFAITQPNTAISVSGGSQQSVTWDVSSSNLPPVSCANVKISLSADGGNSFPYVLAATTANDGSETVAMPAVNSNKCRIKVEAVGNIFFDISNADFTITSTSGCPGQYDTSNNNTVKKASIVPLNTDIKGTINTSTDRDFYRFTVVTAGTYTITLTTIPANYNFTVINSSNIAIGQSANGGTTDESIVIALSAGDYAVKIIGKSGAFDAANCYTLRIASPSLAIIASSAAAINNDLTSRGVQVYPNPASLITTLHFPEPMNNVQITLTDVSGQPVLRKYYKTIAAGQQVDLSLQRVSKGAYFIKINSKTSSGTLKLLVQ